MARLPAEIRAKYGGVRALELAGASTPAGFAQGQQTAIACGEKIQGYVTRELFQYILESDAKIGFGNNAQSLI